MKKLLLVLLCLPMIGFGQCVSGDCKNGYGTYIWASGDKYEGQWKDYKKDGQGTYTSASGAKYKGQWKDDKSHGQGTYTSSSGDKYEGQWKDDNKSGQGTYTWASGDKYEGQWKDDKFHGQGTYTDPNGLIWSGEYEMDEQKEGCYNIDNIYNIDDIIGSKTNCVIELTMMQKMMYINLGFGKNSIIKQDFLFDTGATRICISKAFASKLEKNGVNIEILNIKNGTAVIATNELVAVKYAKIDNLTIGDYTLNNVIITICEQDCSLLFGIDTLNKFSDFTVSKKGKLHLYR